MELVIASRGSNLALIQTNIVKTILEKKFSNLKIHIKIIQTAGDKILDKEVCKIGGKGVFVKEIEQALLDGKADIAVHSMKDIPSVSPEGLIFLPPPKAEAPNDVLVAKEKIKNLSDISGYLIGTGSARRKLQICELANNISVKPIRGNIETRIKKIQTENLDGVILAKAGLSRIGWEDKISYVFSPQQIIPAPCQGILAIQCKEGNKAITYLNEIANEKAKLRFETERAFQKELNANCHSPMGIYSDFTSSSCKLLACFGDLENNILIRQEISGDLAKRVDLAKSLANTLKEDVYKKLN